MAKLCADMTYNQRLYQESNIIIPNIEPPLIIPQEDQDDTIEMETPLIQEDEEVLDLTVENDDDDQNNEDIEMISKKFSDNLAEWLKILEEIEEEELEFLDIDIEDIEHPAQNHNAKWNLDIIFKNDLHCPF